jgi:hypothetical protein
MDQIGTSGAVDKEDYQGWPLFKKFRSTPRFAEAYRRIFKTEFEIREVSPEVASALSLAHGGETSSEIFKLKPRPKRSRGSSTSMPKKVRK